MVPIIRSMNGGKRHIRHSLDLGHSQYPKIGLPLMESIQGIVIRAEVLRNGLPTTGLIEHSAERPAVDNSPMNCKADDASGKLIHGFHNPDDTDASLTTEAVTFRQLSANAETYRDAVEFKNGLKVRLQDLEEGQSVDVLALSSEKAGVREGKFIAAHAYARTATTPAVTRTTQDVP